jgi:hypothetical protein
VEDIMKEQEKQHIINKLIGIMDFEKIRAYMVLNDWTYKGNDSAPSIDRLRVKSIGLIRQALKEYESDIDSYSISCGGFRVTLTSNRNLHDVCIDLTFSPFHTYETIPYYRDHK